MVYGNEYRHKNTQRERERAHFMVRKMEFWTQLVFYNISNTH